MKILFDHCVPAPLRECLHDHTVVLASELGWHDLENGELITKVEEAAFDLFISTDQNIRYQQAITGRRVALLIVLRQNWPALRPHATEVLSAVNKIQPGEYRELTV